MIYEPTHWELSRIPRLYETEDIPFKKKTLYFHFTIFDCHWYMAEFDSEDRDDKERYFFGYAILNNDFQNGEWGYMSYDEMTELNIADKEVIRDLDWIAKNVCEVEEIMKGKWNVS